MHIASIWVLYPRLTHDYWICNKCREFTFDTNRLTNDAFLLFFFPLHYENRIKIELHFSLIAAAVTYIMWKNVGNDKIQKVEGKRFLDDGLHSDGSASRGTLDPKKRRSGYWRVDCQSASKGLFLGLLCLVGGIIILIIFFVMKVIRNNL